jgi:hypothetical protein
MRCGGLLVLDRFDDVWEFGGPVEFQGVRCLNCGSVEDAVMRANRLQFISEEHGVVAQWA